MNEYFARLSSAERRFVFLVLLIVFVVLNAWLVWPHFSDWKKLNARGDKAHTTLAKFEKTIADSSSVEARIKELAGAEGDETVPTEDEASRLVGSIQSQAAQSGVTIVRNDPLPVRTNSVHFVERAQNLSVQAGEDQLVNFLYNISAAKTSVIRARSLSLHPDQPHHILSGNITLVASYQKKTPVRAAAPVAAPAPASKPATAPKPASTPAPASKAAVTNKPPSSVPAPPKTAPSTKK